MRFIKQDEMENFLLYELYKLYRPYELNSLIIKTPSKSTNKTNAVRVSVID